MTKHNDSPLDMIRYIAKDALQPDSLEWRIKHENPEHYDEYMKIIKREGNEHRWVSKEGYKCKIWRNPSGAWCGYVTIPKEHKMYGKHYDDVNVYVEVHGGLTFGEGSDCKGELSEGDDDCWTFGFDTAHAGDIMLGMKEFIIEKSSDGYQYPRNVYRTKEYTINQTRGLSEQLKELEFKELK